MSILRSRAFLEEGEILIHSFQSTKSDGGDATLVKPSDWNGQHVGDEYGILPAYGSFAGNEEFEAALSGWTKTDASGSALNYDITTAPSHLYMQKSGSNGEISRITKALPGGLASTYSITARLRDYVIFSENARIELALYTGSAGSETIQASIGKEIYSGTQQIITIGGATQHDVGVYYQRELFFRMTYNGSTASFYYSFNGMIYRSVRTGVSITTPTRFGFTVTIGSEAQAACDWIRFS